MLFRAALLPILALIVGLTSASTYAQGIDESAPNSEKTFGDPVGGLLRGVGNLLGGVLSSRERELKSLVDKKRFREAASYYAKESAYFDRDRSRVSELLNVIATSLNREYEPSLIAAKGNLEKAMAEAGGQSSGAFAAGKVLQTIIEAAQNELAAYNTVYLLSQSGYRSSHAVNVEALLSRAREKVDQLGIIAFSEFDHFSGESFFSAYPISGSWPHFLGKNLKLLEPRIARAEASQIDRFLTTYASQLTNEDKQTVARFQLEALRRSGTEGSLLSSARQLQEVARRHNIAEASPSIRLVYLTDGVGEGRDFDITISDDHGLNLTKAALDEATSMVESVGSPTTVFVRILSSRVDRKVISRREETSRFESGTRSTPNPEHEIARQRYLQAESSLRQSQFRNSLTPPAQNWAQVLGRVIGETAEAVSRDNAFQAYQNTPPTVTETVYTPYSFRVSEIEITKNATIEITAIDPTARRYWKTLKELSDQKRMHLAFNVHPRDESRYSVSSRYSSETDIKSFESAPITVTSSSILDEAMRTEGLAITYAAVTQIITTAGPVRSTDQQLSIRTDNQRQLVVDDPRFDSVVVVINPKGATGSGFFVEPNLILTNYHVIEGAEFAEIKLKDGREIYGKVVKTDPGRDLALVRVSDAGKPVRFSAEPLAVGQQVEAIGHPAGLRFSLTRGVVSAVRRLRSPEVGEVLMIQTDAPISPGNSGGPLYSGNQVVGINTMKRTTKGAEGLGFAVHASEAQRFLSQK